MKQTYTQDQKQAVLNQHLFGNPVSEIATTTGIPRSTIYAWIKSFKDGSNTQKNEPSIRDYKVLGNKVKRLEGIIEILQSVDCTAKSPLDIKLNALEDLYNNGQSKYSVRMLCDALCVPRGTFYNHILRNKRENTTYARRRKVLSERIQQIYDESHQIYGAVKICAVLKEEGYIVSDKMVSELMNDLRLGSIRQAAKGMYIKEQRKYKNRLQQQFDVKRPNEVWVSDVTFFRYNDKNFYICAVLDLYARTVIGFKIGKHNSTQLVKDTFKIAYENRKPKDELIFHTDRGTNYRSKAFCNYLTSLGVMQSFSRTRTPYDNSVMESFFANLKREELYRIKYRSERELRTAVKEYMSFYNERRPHSKNGYKTPLDKEREYMRKQVV